MHNLRLWRDKEASEVWIGRNKGWIVPSGELSLGEEEQAESSA